MVLRLPEQSRQHSSKWWNVSDLASLIYKTRWLPSYLMSPYQFTYATFIPTLGGLDISIQATVDISTCLNLDPTNTGMNGAPISPRSSLCEEWGTCTRIPEAASRWHKERHTAWTGGHNRTLQRNPVECSKQSSYSKIAALNRDKLSCVCVFHDWLQNHF